MTTHIMAPAYSNPSAIVITYLSGSGGHLWNGVGKTVNLANLGVATPWLIETAIDLLLHQLAYGYAHDFEGT